MKEVLIILQHYTVIKRSNFMKPDGKAFYSYAKEDASFLQYVYRTVWTKISMGSCETKLIIFFGLALERFLAEFELLST